MESQDLGLVDQREGGDLVPERVHEALMVPLLLLQHGPRPQLVGEQGTEGLEEIGESLVYVPRPLLLISSQDCCIILIGVIHQETGFQLGSSSGDIFDHIITSSLVHSP